MIDFADIVFKKFFKWAANYANFPPECFSAEKDYKSNYVTMIIAMLIFNGVFSLEELKEEMKANQIPLHRRYYEEAKRLNQANTYPADEGR